MKNVNHGHVEINSITNKKDPYLALIALFKEDALLRLMVVGFSE